VAIINRSVSKEDVIMPPTRLELLDELLKDDRKPDDLLGQDGLLQQFTKALVERALHGELTYHLGYEKHDSAGDNSGYPRNGTTPKTLRGKRGQVQIDVALQSSSRSSSRRTRRASTASTRRSSLCTRAG
jgi:transposase-like protein